MNKKNLFLVFIIVKIATLNYSAIKQNTEKNIIETRFSTEMLSSAEREDRNNTKNS